MTLQERIARVINQELEICGAAFEEVDDGGVCIRHQDQLTTTAQAIINELGLVEDPRYLETLKRISALYEGETK